jgi:signal transduction histidine kinase
MILVLRFQVVDTGPGIPPALREKIFELFYQGGNFSASPGKGMGLTVAKALSERLNGHLTLIENDQCTCFELIVPARLIAR